jgi:hypothetical protein
MLQYDTVPISVTTADAYTIQIISHPSWKDRQTDGERMGDRRTRKKEKNITNIKK